MNNKIRIFFILILFSTNSIFSQTKEEKIPLVKSVTIGEPSTISDDFDVEIPFSILEDVPKFEACKDSIGQAAKTCFFLKLNEHITKNFNYPEEAFKQKIEGRTHVMFVINKLGEVEKIKVRRTRKAGSEYLEAESERIIKLLPKFIPGMQRGRLVNVSLAVPINFKLDE